MAYMSEEGYKQLIEELKYLESVERPKIVSAIAEARDKGDLSENAEYDAAKEAQGLLEMKISQLKSTIGDAKIIDTSKMNADTVQILTKVELKNAKTGMKMVYTIVAESEANLKLSLLSTTRTSTGIMVSWEGVSGQNWRYGSGLIKKLALAEQKEILVVDKYDLGHIRNGSSNLLKILYEKHLSLVTDIDYQKYIQSHEAESLLNN